MTLPDSSFLPSPLWVITALHVLTLSLHFAAMNFVLGGTLIVLTGRFDRRWEKPYDTALHRPLPKCHGSYGDVRRGPSSFPAVGVSAADVLGVQS